MGNGNSKTIEIGQKVEDAIRFNVGRLEFEGDVSEHLEKVRPEIERASYGIFWTTTRENNPTAGTVTETQYQYPEESIFSRNAIRTTNFHMSSDEKTVVIIKPIDQLKEFPKIDWQAVLENKIGNSQRKNITST